MIWVLCQTIYHENHEYLDTSTSRKPSAEWSTTSPVLSLGITHGEFPNCLTVSCIVFPAELSTVHGTHSGWSKHSYFFELKQNTFSILPSWLFNDLIKKLILDLGSWGSTGAMGLMDGKEVMHDRKCRDISIKASGVSSLSFFWF